jgi:hypothetical protein
MIQLGYYSTSQQQHQDESLDFDPTDEIEPQQYQEPFEYASNVQEDAGGDDLTQQQNYYGSFAQQAFNANDFGFQQPQQMVQEDYSQQPTQPQMMISNDGGGLADLEISDSDDEDDQIEEPMDTSQNPADTSKDDDGGLWF